jgi:hypothetical protein
MELIQRAKDDHATGEVSHERAVCLPRNLRPVMPDATSRNLGWVGLQAFRYRDSATNEIHWPPDSRYLWTALASHSDGRSTYAPEGGKIMIIRRAFAPFRDLLPTCRRPPHGTGASSPTAFSSQVFAVVHLSAPDTARTCNLQFRRLRDKCSVKITRVPSCAERIGF